jgi:hypothetical protein
MLDSRITQVGTVTVIVLFDEKVEKAMIKIQDFASSAVDFYTQQIGFYPQKYLIILAGDDEALGGYPVDRGIIAIHGIDNFDNHSIDCWKWISAHEVAHMYWGYFVLDGTAKDDARLGWLTIGLGIYLDKWYVDDLGICISFHTDAIRSYLQLDCPKEKKSFNLKKDEIAKLDFDYNRIILHGKAYYVITQIEQTLGQDRFRSIYNEMLRSYGGRVITYEKIKKLAYDKTGIKLSIEI